MAGRRELMNALGCKRQRNTASFLEAARDFVREWTHGPAISSDPAVFFRRPLTDSSSIFKSKGAYGGPSLTFDGSRRARAAYQFLSARTMCTGGDCGLGKQSPQELMAWKASLQEQEKRMNAERVSLDAIRLAITNSWMNLGKVQKRLPPPTTFGLLKSLLHEKIITFLSHAVGVTAAYLLVMSVAVYSLQPGEAQKLPGNIIVSAATRVRGVVNGARAVVGLPPLPPLEKDDNVLDDAPSSSGPPSVVVILGGGHGPGVYSGPVLEVPSMNSSRKE